MSFLKLIEGGTLFAPEDLGQQDVLMAGEKIAAVGQQLVIPGNLEVERISAEGKVLTPGFIDLHVHITGGGGEGGPASRLPEINVGAILAAGVTTVLGVLGTDAITRSTEALVAKAQGLEQEGITAFALSGSYSFPSLVTLTGSVQKDIALIPQIIGTGELALSDHRGPQATFEEFIRVVADTRVGGLVGNKPGLVVIHMGGGAEGMAKLFRMAAETEIPLYQVLPTHCTRNERLFAEALKFAALGGNIDLTARGEGETPKLPLPIALEHLRSKAIALSQVTVSSDSNGSLPRFNQQGQLTGFQMAAIDSLTEEFRNLVLQSGWSADQALQFFTRNPAARLGLTGQKGVITSNAAADLILFDENWQIDSVFARGKAFVRNGRLLKCGFYNA